MRSLRPTPLLSAPINTINPRARRFSAECCLLPEKVNQPAAGNAGFAPGFQMGHRCPGVPEAGTLSGLSRMSFPQSTPGVTRWCALVVAIALVFPTVMSVVSAVKAERSGTALYSSSWRLPATEPVTRSSSPDKFREAVRMDWFRAMLFGSLTFISFYFFRRLSE